VPQGTQALSNFSTDVSENPTKLPKTTSQLLRSQYQMIPYKMDLSEGNFKILSHLQKLLTHNTYCSTDVQE